MCFDFFFPPFSLSLSLFPLQNLNSNSPQDDDFDSTIAGLPDNMAKNRFKVHLPGIPTCT